MPESSDERYEVLPFYIVCDVSSSMSTGNAIGGLNEVLPVLQDAAAKNPILGDIVQLGVIAFNTDAHEKRTMSVIGQNDTLSFTASGGTEFGAVLRKLKSVIQRDVAALKAQNAKVYRPAVFFLSDGGPNDNDWKSAFTDLTEYNSVTGAGFKQYPLIVPLGLGQADRAVLQSMVFPPNHSKLYMIDNPSQDAATAIAEMAEIMIHTIINSANSARSGGEIHVLPDRKELPHGVAVYGYDGGDEV